MTKDQPWIDGAVTPPTVGSVIRFRAKNAQSPPHDRSVVFVDSSQTWAGYIYYVLEEAPREYVPPVEPLPELEDVTAYGLVGEESLPGKGWQVFVTTLDGYTVLLAMHADRATARRIFNAAVRELLKA